ncbi:hypothetical protein VTO42DRAFT_7689 [Malbranchea cinnamomea]
MSYKSIEQALATLLPTHAEDLPDELVKLSAHLLAQSRSYASSLKAEEEIARPYACAEIACKRLSKQLKLPATVGRPPCPPRVYKKLFAYLEQVFSKTSANSKRQVINTPSRSTAGRTAAVSSTATTTPSKSPAKRPVRGPFSGHSVAKPGRGTQTGRIKDAPSWTMAVIRKICQALATPTSSSFPYSQLSISTSFPPHVFAGLSSILSFIAPLLSDLDSDGQKPSSEFFLPLKTDDPESQDGQYRERITTLIVAIYLVVLRRTHSTVRLDEDMFSSLKQAALSSAGMTNERFSRDVDTWMEIVFQNGWVHDQEWFKNVPKLNAEGNARSLGSKNQDDDEEDDDEDDIVTIKKRRMMNRQAARASAQVELGGLLPGLGTMMSDRIDWLSEERRIEYLTWREDILERIKAIEEGAVAS